MNFKSYLSIGAASIAVLAGANVANAAQIAPGTLQFDSFGGGAFYGNNFVDWSGPGNPSAPSPGVDAPIEISTAPFTNGAFDFLAGTFAEISDLPALPFLVEDGEFYNIDTIFGAPLEGFLNDFNAAPGLKFDLEGIQRDSDNLGRVQFNLEGEFNGGGFDPTPVVFEFSLITAQIPPTAPSLTELAYFDPEVVGLFPNAETSEGLNNPTESGGVITGTPCGGDTGVECETGFNSYSGQVVTNEQIPEPSSMLGLFTLIGFAGLSKVRIKK